MGSILFDHMCLTFAWLNYDQNVKPKLIINVYYN